MPTLTDMIDSATRPVIAPKATPGFVPSRYQEDFFHELLNGSTDIQLGAVAGSGKCLGAGTPVMLFDGRIIPVEDVCAGDLLMGPDSRPRRVLSTCSGESPLYEIQPTKGMSWVCNDVHMLTLTGTNRFKGKVIDIPLDEYLDRCRASKSFVDQWKLFRVAVEFTAGSGEVDIDPYFIGLWLGDGTTNAVQFTTPEPEIVEYLTAFAPLYGAEAIITNENDRGGGLKSVYLRIGEKYAAKRGTHYLRQQLLNHFRNEHKQKAIPAEYLTASRQNRLELLAGLLDTDGYYGTGSYEITSKYEHLAEQIAFIARSLGLAAYITRKPVQLASMAEPRDYWRLSISGDVSIIPCRIPQKQAGPRGQMKSVLVTGFTVRPIGEGRYYGFTLDGDGRFLLGDFTVTHNTKTIEEGTNRLPHSTRSRTLLTAFNSHIKQELLDRQQAGRIPANITIQTIHGLGYGVLRRTFNPTDPRAWVDERKYDKLADIFWSDVPQNHYDNWDERRDAVDATKKLIRLTMLTLTPETDAQALRGLAQHHDVLIPARFEAEVFDGIAQSLKWGREGLARPDREGRTWHPSDRISFDDMVYLPNVLHLSVPQFHLAFIDECQDFNEAQFRLLLKVKGAYGRAVWVGDRRQAIYGFAGSSAESYDNIARVTGAKQLPLSICYRCAKSVVARAKNLVPQIECADDAPDGLVEDLSTDDELIEMAVKHFNDPERRQEQFLLLCRVNAPLVSTAFGLIRRGIPALVKGRDIGQQLVRTIDEIAKMRDFQFADFPHYAMRYRALKESALAGREGTEMQLASLYDRVDSVLAVYEAATIAGHADIPAMRGHVQRLFSDEMGAQAIVLSSIHKAKGLEAERVGILRADLLPHPMAKQPWMYAQEQNCAYIAVTRARKELYIAGAAGGF